MHICNCWTNRLLKEKLPCIRVTRAKGSEYLSGDRQRGSKQSGRKEAFPVLFGRFGNWPPAAAPVSGLTSLIHHAAARTPGATLRPLCPLKHLQFTDILEMWPNPNQQQHQTKFLRLTRPRFVQGIKEDQTQTKKKPPKTHKNKNSSFWSIRATIENSSCLKLCSMSH